MLSGYFKSWNRTFHICPAYFVFNTFHCAIFHLRLRGPCEGPECDLGAIPKHLCALGISSVERDAHRPSLQDGPKEIAPGNAWRRSRPRVSAPEMSTIVLAGKARRGDWTDLPRDTRWANARLEASVPSRAGGVACPRRPDRKLGQGAHSLLLPSPLLAFDSGEQRVAEQINFLHTSLCAAPRPLGPRPRPRPAPTT